MNNTKRYWFCFMVSFFACSFVAAEPLTLNKDLVTSFKSLTNKMGLLNKEFPELAEHSQQFDFDQSENVIKFLKSSKAYPKIKSLLQDSKIDNLQQIFELSQKVMGGLYYLNRKKDDTNQSPTQFEVIRKVLENNLKTLKEQDAQSFSDDNSFLIEEAEIQLALLDKQLVIVNQALESLTDKDKSFLDEHSAWFKKQFVTEPNVKQSGDLGDQSE